MTANTNGESHIVGNGVAHLNGNGVTHTNGNDYGHRHTNSNDMFSPRMSRLKSIRKQSSPLAPPFMVSAPGKVIVFGEHSVVYGKVRSVKLYQALTMR
jgi:mevalonate kinase